MRPGRRRTRWRIYFSSSGDFYTKVSLFSVLLVKSILLKRFLIKIKKW
nr:MAG TPA: hypothetical protein [Caudoviricetes sp.]